MTTVLDLSPWTVKYATYEPIDPCAGACHDVIEQLSASAYDALADLTVGQLTDGVSVSLLDEAVEQAAARLITTGRGDLAAELTAARKSLAPHVGPTPWCTCADDYELNLIGEVDELLAEFMTAFPRVAVFDGDTWAEVTGLTFDRLNRLRPGARGRRPHPERWEVTWDGGREIRVILDGHQLTVRAMTVQEYTVADRVSGTAFWSGADFALALPVDLVAWSMDLVDAGIDLHLGPWCLAAEPWWPMSDPAREAARVLLSGGLTDYEAVLASAAAAAL